ncbi:MAG TPA: PASTA domain-containing protein [Gaiellaceae bacterium]|nr:PASTA domain-containing protein [Gaiellaceae bacterium]
MARRPVPADLEDALAADVTARERFWALPPEQLDRWVAYVERARFPGQRRRRIAETVRRLGGGRAVTEVREGGAVALPRDDWALWLLGLALLAAVAGFLVWWFAYRHTGDNGPRSGAVVITAKSTVPKLIGIKLQAAEFQLKEAKLGSKVVRRASAKKTGTVLGQAPKPGKRVVQGSVVTLTVSKGKPGVAVPKLVGLAAADAVQQLQSKGLTAKLQQAAAKAPPGTVVKQSPAAGKRAKRGTAVQLTVAKGAAAVAVADVTGKSQQAAQSALQAQGLATRVVQVPSSQPAGTVVAQSPAAGTKVQQGATVRLNVARSAPAQSTPGSATTTAPQQGAGGNDYRGMRLAAAVQRIVQGRQQVIVQYVASSQPAGVVVANSRAGGRVRLQVSAGAQPQPSTSVPDTTGEDPSSAQSDLTGAGFSVVTAQWPVSDQSKDGAVVYQTPTGSAPKGSAVVVYVGAATG